MQYQVVKGLDDYGTNFHCLHKSVGFCRDSGSCILAEGQTDGELMKLSERDIHVTLAPGPLQYEQLGTLAEFWKPADLPRVVKTLSFRYDSYDSTAERAEIAPQHFGYVCPSAHDCSLSALTSSKLAAVMQQFVLVSICSIHLSNPVVSWYFTSTKLRQVLVHIRSSKRGLPV